MNDIVVPAREVFRHFSAPMVAVFYLAAVLSLGAFAWGCWTRIRKYLAGTAGKSRADWWPRIVRATTIIAAHARLRDRDRVAGWAHLLIFWGFAALTVGTAIIAVNHDILRYVAPGLQFWSGDFYLWNSLILDVLGGGMLVGLVVMAWRRWGLRLPQLDYRLPGGTPLDAGRLAWVRDDTIFLVALFLIGLTGFLVEGLRILADRPAFEVWSVLGWRVADALEASGVSRAAAGSLHPYAWFAHGLLALAFIAYIPYSKAIHMLAGIANVYLHDPDAGRTLPDIDAERPSAGYRELRDFERRELVALDACTKCGRCHVRCPARAGGWPLSPRDLILSLRERAELELGGRSWHQFGGGSGPGGALAEPATIWACTTCLACVDACPVMIEHVPMIVRMRRALVEDGQMDRGLQAALEKLGRSGNSFGEPERTRAHWTEGLPFPIKDARREPVEFLWFVGDYASYDPALRPVTRAAARLLHASGLDFGILHESECNSGNDIRRVGEEGLYQMLVEKNVEALGRARFQQIVTTDPHSYNTLKFEYPRFGASHRVRHFAEVMWEAIEAGRLRPRTLAPATVTYHDPCHLSRYAKVTEAPRAILKALGLRLVEMERHGADSFCCGAGGGRIWMTDAGKAERPAVQRMHEALRIQGVSCFVVACPKDRGMFRDAANTVTPGNPLPVKDLIELLDEAVP